MPDVCEIITGGGERKNGHPALMGSLWAPEELNTKLLGVKADGRRRRR